MLVLWGARRGDVQLNSAEDRHEVRNQMALADVLRRATDEGYLRYGPSRVIVGDQELEVRDVKIDLTTER